MKTTLKLTFAIVILLVTSQVQGQIKFGPEIGLNFSQMNMKSSGTEYTPKTLMGFHIGLISEFSLSENLFVQPGILYSSKGSKFDIMGTEAEVSPSYIEIPINLMYKFNLGAPKVFILAGPYIAYGIGGKIKVAGQTQDIQFGSDSNSDMKPLDYGLSFGAGVEIANIELSARYELGLANLAPQDPSNNKFTNKVFAISLAYLIGKK